MALSHDGQSVSRWSYLMRLMEKGYRVYADELSQEQKTRMARLERGGRVVSGVGSWTGQTYWKAR